MSISAVGDWKNQKSSKHANMGDFNHIFAVGAHRRVVNVLTSNSAFLIFAVLVV